MLALCHWIDRTQFFVGLQSWNPLAVLWEVIHYFSMFMIVGCMGIVDLRILGLLGQRQSVSELARDLLPWMWIGIVLNVISGVIMFTGEATAYYLSGPFRIKILLVILAIVVGVVVNQNVPKWSQLTIIPARVKVLALLAIILWIGAIVAGVYTPAISGTG